MDYRKLSDFEIDKAVADALGIEYDIAIMFVNPVDKINGNHVEEYVRKKITSNEKQWRRFSPTRIPNDAFHIIEANRISLRNRYEGDWKAENEWGDSHFHVACNPLRAAMVVFLMMQDARNEK